MGVMNMTRAVRFAGALAISAAVSPVASAAPRDEALPQRNLLVEWRTSGQGQSQQREQGIRTGQIIVDSRGVVIGRSSIGLGSVQTESRSDSVQQVQVLNGGRARLYVGRSAPYSVWQWAGSHADGGQPQAWAQTVWIDLGEGLSVRPRWPGGQAPVVVEFEAQMRQPMQAGGAGGAYSGQMAPDGQSRRMEVGSTLSVPLGQWAVVARSGSQAQRQQSGTLSTRELDDGAQTQLEIRITAP
jgi:hypothetical protein